MTTRPQRSRTLLAATLLAVLTGLPAAPAFSDTTGAVATAASQSVRAPRIQIAILLDTSNSMDGLIDQARNQLWHAVNEFSKAKREGLSPILEVAVFEYGNNGLSTQDGYTRQVVGLTRELDRVSEALFGLTTNGGDEYCGLAIQTAARQLQWSTDDNDIKAIFIAGNEPFTQGPVPYTAAIDEAKRRGIVVNTIHAGPHDEGIQTGWYGAAMLTAGNYMSIDHNHQIAHVEAPQDQKIAELNQRLNQTYIPYGSEGAAGASRQAAQDANTSGISSALLAERAKAKAGASYSNTHWDLVDAVKAGEVDLDALAPEALPAPMAAMPAESRAMYLEEQSEAREAIKREITALTEERDEYVAGQREQEAGKPAVTTLNDAIVGAVRAQGEEKRFEFAGE